MSSHSHITPFSASAHPVSSKPRRSPPSFWGTVLTPYPVLSPCVGPYAYRLSRLSLRRHRSAGCGHTSSTVVSVREYTRASAGAARLQSRSSPCLRMRTPKLSVGAWRSYPSLVTRDSTVVGMHTVLPVRALAIPAPAPSRIRTRSFLARVYSGMCICAGKLWQGTHFRPKSVVR